MNCYRLDDNQLNNHVGVSLERAVAVNKTLLRLGLAYCGIPVRRLAAVERGLKENARFLHARFAMAVHSVAPHPFQFCSVLVGGQKCAGKTSTLQALLDVKEQMKRENGSKEIHAVLSGSGRLRPAKGEPGDYVTSFAHRVMAGAFSKHAPKTTETTVPTVVEQEAAPIALRSRYSYSKEKLRETKDAEAVRILVWDGGSDPIVHNYVLSQSRLCVVFIDLTSPLASIAAALFAWLASASLYAPTAQVLVVASKLDQVDESEQQSLIQRVNELALSAVKDGNERLVSCRMSGLCVFPVSSVSGSGLTRVREALSSAVQKNPVVYAKVSSRWLQCLDALRSYGKRMPTIRFGKVEELLKDKVPGIAFRGYEMQSMLKLFHDMGFIVFYTATFSLRSTIVLRRQWMAQTIGRIIHPEREHTQQEKRALKKAGLEEDSALLRGNGVLTEDLLAFLVDVDHLDFFIDLLQHLLVISAWNVAGNGRRFRVPSMLVPDQRGQENSNGMLAKFEFKSLPPGVFERLVCLLVSTKSGEASEASTLWRDVARVKLSQGNEVIVRLQLVDGVIEVEFLREERAGQTLRMLDTLLRRINDGFRFVDGQLSWTILVRDGFTFRQLQSDKLEQLRDGPWATPKAKRRDVNYERFLQL